MARIGYARVSTLDQDLEGQVARLKAEGCAIDKVLVPELRPGGSGGLELFDHFVSAGEKRGWDLDSAIGVESRNRPDP